MGITSRLLKVITFISINLVFMGMALLLCKILSLEVSGESVSLVHYLYSILKHLMHMLLFLSSSWNFAISFWFGECLSLH